MQNYKVATIPEGYITEITVLENRIRKETGKDVAIVAYEPDNEMGGVSQN